MIRLLWFAMALAVLGTQGRRGAKTYVVSPMGDDANVGTVDSPFRTVQKGVDSCSLGDTLTVRTGVYHEYVTLHRSGNFFDRAITIDATGAILDGEDVDGAGHRAIFDTNYQDHVTVRGLTVRNGGWLGFEVLGSYRIRLEDCRSMNTPGSGIHIDKSQDVTVERCEVEKACQGSGEESVSIKRSSSVVFQDCHVHDTGHEGIDVKEGSQHVRVVGCHVHHVERQGLYADAWDADTFDIRFERNTIHDCMVGLVVCTETGGLLHDVWFVNNLVYHCGPGMMVAKWGEQRMSHRIRNVYFVNNTVVGCGAYGSKPTWGGGMLLENDQAENVVVMNNVLSGNTDGQLRITVGLPPKSMTVRNNLLDGVTENFGEGNIVAKAKFVDAAKHDYRLVPGSPGIDAGYAVDGVGDVDISGGPRVKGRIDIGAYEAK